MSSQGRVLRIYRDGRRHEKVLTRQLPVGAKANLETLLVMKQIVNEDAKETDIKNFVFREIIGLDKKTLPAQIEAAYRFCQKQIKYESEADGFETVCDLWSALYRKSYPAGDCSIKSVSLATCLSYLGLKQEFVAVQQIPNAKFYNHVFLCCFLDGKRIYLDPTPDRFNVGDKLPSFNRLHLPI